MQAIKGRAELDPNQVKLRRSREQANLTRDRLAHLLNVSVRTLARWEIEPGRLDDDNFHRAMSTIGARAVEIEAKGNTLDLSQVPSIELARELTRRLEHVEGAQRELQAKLEAQAHFPSF